jgi:hypothetical protein
MHATNNFFPLFLLPAASLGQIASRSATGKARTMDKWQSLRKRESVVVAMPYPQVISRLCAIGPPVGFLQLKTHLMHMYAVVYVQFI